MAISKTKEAEIQLRKELREVLEEKTNVFADLHGNVTTALTVTNVMDILLKGDDDIYDLVTTISILKEHNDK